MPDQQPIARCSFCKKDSEQVTRLVAGPTGALICDQCVRRATAILQKERGTPP